LFLDEILIRLSAENMAEKVVLGDVERDFFAPAAWVLTPC
jgi:hypothetical protein